MAAYSAHHNSECQMAFWIANSESEMLLPKTKLYSENETLFWNSNVILKCGVLKVLSETVYGLWQLVLGGTNDIAPHYVR